jgi:beta-barrel assembly-enhancing protease
MYKYTLIFLCLVGFSHAQTDFNNYYSLRSKGAIPDDFTKSSKSKMEEDLKSKSSQSNKAKEKIFYEGVNYAIDEMLHSGLVVYGDEISTYVNDIMDKLLQHDPDLRRKLRAYTIKSNATNAFSTDQGIIFVTTGLMAQITNEAQLAYILAHEIAHYQHKHVKETFDWKQKNYRYSDRINRLSNHSKDKEFEADKEGLLIYHKAGYALDPVFETFDVLMYSYLPFDEVQFPSNYFNTDKIFLPLGLFPKKNYPIKAEEDYDDENSSHPNIKKRKEAIEKEVGVYANWGDAAFLLDQSRFKTVQNIARFENVRSDILDAQYGDAVYSIFLLEKEFPASMYLKRMKAQVWLNLTLYKKENKSNRTIDNMSDLEGESAAVHFFLKKLSRDGMVTLALRNIHDIYKQHPEDEEIKAIYTKFISELGGFESFKLENFSKRTFSEAAEDFLKAKADTSVQAVENESGKTGSKYDRIKKQKSAENPNNFDSTKFHLYALTDLIADEAFLSIYKEWKDKSDAKKAKDDAFASLSRKEKEKIRKQDNLNQMRINLQEVIVVEPTVQSFRKGQLDNMKSEEIETKYSEIIEATAADVGIKVFPIDRRVLNSSGTPGYNERNLLISFLSQIAQEDEINIFPVDYHLLKELQNNYGTSKVMFTLVQHEKKIDINWWYVGASVILYPALPFVLSMHIPMRIFNSNKTEMSVIILDLEKGIVETGSSYYFEEPVHKHNLGAHVYDIFSNLKMKPL